MSRSTFLDTCIHLRMFFLSSILRVSESCLREAFVTFRRVDRRWKENFADDFQIVSDGMGSLAHHVCLYSASSTHTVQLRVRVDLADSGLPSNVVRTNLLFWHCVVNFTVLPNVTYDNRSGTKSLTTNAISTFIEFRPMATLNINPRQ